MISLTSTDRLRKLRKSEEEDTVSGKVYTRRLRQQFERIYPIPEWAQSTPNPHDPENADDIIAADPLSAFFQSSAPLTQRSTAFLPEDILAITAVASIPVPAKNPAPRTVHFHPSHPLILIGYEDNTLRIHSIDGKHNPLATALKLSRLRIQSAVFHPTKNLVYATGLRRRGIFIWDLNTGAVRKIEKTFNEESMASGEWSNLRIAPDGQILGVQGSTGWLCLLSAETGQFLGGCKIEGVIADYTFTSDGNKAVVISVGGEVWEFDTTQKAVVDRWRDEGGVSLSRVALSPDGRFLAIGSASGIVTIYDLQSEKPHSPARTVYNLTTPITSLEFAPDGQMLVMASSGKRDQLRVVHIPALKVFPNWPTSKTPLGVIQSVGLGDNRYLAVARRKGVALWKVRD
jgi:U3 small nucleolar RNA-associated protein 18